MFLLTKHTYPSFKLGAWPAHKLRVSRYLQLDITSIVDKVVDMLLLYNISLDPEHSNLVNIVSKRSQSSYGHLSSIPDYLISNTHTELLLTFIIDGNIESAQPTTKFDFRKYNERLVLWNDQDTRYVTVRFRLADVPWLMRIDTQPLVLEYLYSGIGLCIRNIARFSRLITRVRFNSFDEFFVNQPLYAWNNRIGTAKVIDTILTRIPYMWWVFNPVVWRLHPTLISQRSITDYTAFYYTAYLHQKIGRILYGYRSNFNKTQAKRYGLAVGNGGLLDRLITSSMYLGFNLESKKEYPRFISKYTEVEEFKPAILPLLLGKPSMDRYRDVTIMLQMDEEFISYQKELWIGVNPTERNTSIAMFLWNY